MQVNRQVVALPYVKNGLHVYQSGINYVAEISQLGARISYNGLSFSITLPYRLFGDNTKGQCGEPLGRSLPPRACPRGGPRGCGAGGRA